MNKTANWKTFKIGDVLYKVPHKRINKNAREFPTEPTVEYVIPLITAGATNQGISRYAKREQCPTIIKNAISFASDGSVGSTFYHSEEFAILSNAFALKRKDEVELDETVALFFVACIRKSVTNRFNYAYKAKWDRVKDVTIKLPVDDNGDIDYQYMQERIAELEQERIAELEQERIADLEQYLVATGLNDYTLTDEDREALATRLADADRGRLRNSTSADGCWKEAREIPLSELFTPSNGDFDIQKKHLNGRGIDVVSAGVTGSGFIGKTDVAAKVFEGNTITIDMFGNCFYRGIPYKMATHARVFSLSCKDDRFNELNGLYIVSLIRKRIAGVFGYSNMCSWNKTKDMSIKLPVEDNGDIDWDFMSRYIGAVEKLVIKDVVDWKDRQIAMTRELLASSSQADR